MKSDRVIQMLLGEVVLRQWHAPPECWRTLRAMLLIKVHAMQLDWDLTIQKQRRLSASCERSLWETYCEPTGGGGALLLIIILFTNLEAFPYRKKGMGSQTYCLKNTAMIAGFNTFIRLSSVAWGI